MCTCVHVRVCVCEREVTVSPQCVVVPARRNLEGVILEVVLVRRVHSVKFS